MYPNKNHSGCYNGFLQVGKTAFILSLILLFSTKITAKEKNIKYSEANNEYHTETTFSNDDSKSEHAEYSIMMACNGKPVGGLARISNNIGCSGINFQLSISALAYSFDFEGLSYQWQLSYDGVTWNNIPGETNPQGLQFTTNQTSYFRLSVLCANSGETGYSSVVSYVTENCDSYHINQHNVVNTCSALFYDSGGPAGNYGNNENQTITFCSTSGEKMRVEFLDFNTQDNGQTGRNQLRFDILYVYDGPNINSPPLFEFSGVQSAINKTPVVISSGACITFRFRSDNFNARSGWEAMVTCTTEENRTASQFCETAPNICNLDGYYGTTSNFYNVESVNGQIPGGYFSSLALDNVSFITFVAEAPVVEVDIWVGNCTPANCGSGSQGIQLGVIAGRNCRFTNVLANYGRGILPGNQRLSFTGLTPGEVYYLFVDGFNCSNCDYRINALSGIALAQIDVPLALICEDDEITITASGGTGYVWQDASGNILSTGRSITVTETGVYQVAITGGNALCPDEVILTSTIFTEFCCPEMVEPFKPNTTSICVGDEIPELTVESGDESYQLNWYDAAAGGDLLLQNSNNFTPSIASVQGTYTFYVANQLSGSECFSRRIPIVLQINDYRESIFDTLSTYCIGKAIPQLPSASDNGVTGTWSPPIYSVENTEYIFTPFQDQCSFILNVNIESEWPMDPIFSDFETYCAGEPIAALPTISNNQINGIWSPEVNNMMTTTYLFTPDEDVCASRAVTTITVLQNSASAEVTEACDMYEWKGEVYTQSVVYEHFTTNAVGCDSTITLRLTIYNSDSTIDSIFACDAYIQNEIEYTESGTYIYNGRNSVGCDSTSTMVISIVNSGIYIPNIFRADRGGPNNCFKISASNSSINRFELTIYDRWGNQVFASDSIDDCWDGTFKGRPGTIGVYTYLLIINDPGCGLRKITGDVTLVR